ncbi:MAG: hypothetical protein Q4P24_13450 [Rhodobacterales bacterium]|nr:hypothetical protein [Rhodobacterales bacterium]
MPIKTDRWDAEGIARLLHMGWVQPVHCNSVPAQEVRAMLSARKAIQQGMIALEMSLRGLLRNFGFKLMPSFGTDMNIASAKGRTRIRCHEPKHAPGDLRQRQRRKQDGRKCSDAAAFTCLKTLGREGPVAEVLKS